MPAIKNPEIDIALHALCVHAKPDQSLTQADIAEVCGCHVNNIQTIEKKALRKALIRANNLNLQDFLKDTN